LRSSLKSLERYKRLGENDVVEQLIKQGTEGVAGATAAAATTATTRGGFVRREVTDETRHVLRFLQRENHILRGNDLSKRIKALENSTINFKIFTTNSRKK
jgi:hypothetical protein